MCVSFVEQVTLIEIESKSINEANKKNLCAIHSVWFLSTTRKKSSANEQTNEKVTQNSNSDTSFTNNSLKSEVHKNIQANKHELAQFGYRPKNMNSEVSTEYWTIFNMEKEKFVYRY